MDKKTKRTHSVNPKKKQQNALTSDQSELAVTYLPYHSKKERKNKQKSQPASCQLTHYERI